MLVDPRGMSTPEQAGRPVANSGVERVAAVATVAWWLLFLTVGSLAATAFLGVLLVCAVATLIAVARREGWSSACARIGRGLALSVAIFSIGMVLAGMRGSGSRRAAEDAMELGAIHLALVGPLFLAGLLLAWRGRALHGPRKALVAAYPASWLLILGLESLG